MRSYPNDKGSKAFRNYHFNGASNKVGDRRAYPTVKIITTCRISFKENKMIEWISTAMIGLILVTVIKNTKDIGKLCGLVEKKD